MWRSLKETSSLEVWLWLRPHVHLWSYRIYLQKANINFSVRRFPDTEDSLVKESSVLHLVSSEEFFWPH